MLSKPIFKQSIQANWKLWAIITFVASAILSIFIITFDAEGYASIASAAEGTAFSNMLSTLTSLLGSLENFYKLIAVILGIVYVVFTANSLVVNEVDSGSMAYTLSTPIKRSSVIFTKTLYLVLSIVLMYTIIGGVGMGVSHVTHHNVFGYAVTDDITEAADALNLDTNYLTERLYLIQEDETALKEAAYARGMDTEAYSLYLTSVINERSYEKAAEIITDERWDIYSDDEEMEDEDIEITTEELMADPAMVLTSNDAMEAGAKIQGMSIAEYRQFIADAVEPAEVATPREGEPTPTVVVTSDNAELLLQAAIAAGADALNVDSDRISSNLSLLKDPIALEAATAATDLTAEQITTMANHAMISSAKSVDTALEFDIETYLWLSIGLMLLILALGAISFLASTVFNTTGMALAIGGGIPFAFFIMTMVQQLMDSADNLQYFTITSLFDTDAILAGGDFGWGLVALAAIALVLYTAANVIFTKKDLPL